MKVNENLLCRQTEAAKVATVEKEKKKAQGMAPLVIIEKKTVSKRKNPNVSEKDKEINDENPQPKAAKPQAKKQKAGKVSKGDGDADAIATPQIQPSTFYPLKR
jgi:hypothetical protein